LLQVGAVELNPEARSARLNGEAVALTAKEFDLAMLLLQNLGTLFNRQVLLERVWGNEMAALDTRTVDTHMSRVRRKLELDEAHGWTLTAVYGHGYRLERSQPGGGQ
jgi:DNA-binding response OmpR family regulator